MPKAAIILIIKATVLSVIILGPQLGPGACLNRAFGVETASSNTACRNTAHSRLGMVVGGDVFTS